MRSTDLMPQSSEMIRVNPFSLQNQSGSAYTITFTVAVGDIKVAAREWLEETETLGHGGGAVHIIITKDEYFLFCIDGCNNPLYRLLHGFISHWAVEKPN